MKFIVKIMTISLGFLSAHSFASDSINYSLASKNQAQRSSLQISEQAFQTSTPRGLTLKPVNVGQQQLVNRVALVIGNSEYTTSPLNNPKNDASDISSQLRHIGFDVNFVFNGNKKEMLEAIQHFGESLQKKNTVGLFYYAGHGMQVNGKNFLIPVDADINLEYQIEFEAVDIDRVLAVMDAAQNLMNIVVLDACRDNPFKRSFRSSTKGLAQMDAPSGTFIAYSTAPGQVSSDGLGRNGIYTKNLLAHLSTPGLTVEEMFKRVRIGVMAETAKQQVPWESSSLVGVFYFVPGDQAPINWFPPTIISKQTLLTIKAKPWYKRWYVWAAVAAVTGVALSKCSGGEGAEPGKAGKGGGCAW